MTTWQVLVSTWSIEPSVLVGCLVLLLLYGRATGFQWTSRTIYFALGIAGIMLAQFSPLDTLGDEYLFSAHMAQHLILLLVVPPLLIVGVPVALYRRLLAWRPAGLAERVLGAPLVAWVLGIGAMWVWHAPPLYDATLESEAVHIFEHLTFLVTGCIFWWPVLLPLPEKRRLHELVAMPYLMGAMLGTTVLGIVITFAPQVLYSPYLHPLDELGILLLIQEQWGLLPLHDQHVGGLLMWVPGSLLYLVIALAELARWFSADDEEEDFGAMPNAEARSKP